MFQPNRESLAWAAGFYDGEGCCTAFKSNKTQGRWAAPTIEIPQAGLNGPELLSKFRNSVGGIGKIYGPYWKASHRQTLFRYVATELEAVQAIAAMLWPWLGRPKKIQFLQALEAYKTEGKTKVRRHPRVLRRTFA